MAERKCLPDSCLQWVWLPENIDEKNTGAIIMAFNLFCGIYRKSNRKYERMFNMLNVSHVTKKYGKVTACNDVSFHLDPGSVTVLLGPNGAGKSTIMKSIIGFLRHDGEITVGGLPNKTTDARRLLGYIPEMPSLYPNLTASEHMEFLARAYRLTDYKQRVDELFDRFELNDKRKKFGDELSKGMQQKLNICLGLLPEPKMLLLDEPMIGLDPHAIKQLKSIIEQMRNEGKTLLVSTHIIDSVDMLWDRTIIMQDGQIRANLTREELERDGRTLEQLFFDVTEGIGRDAMSHTEDPASQGG
jgi:ABC-type multidrug transport system ATPase subunit